MSVGTQPAATVGTEFVIEEFETRVESGAVGELATEIEEIVRRFRGAIGDDDRLETLFRSPPGKEILTERDSVERSDPEPLTQQVVIEPLFDLLSYPTFSHEVGDLSGDRGQQADYAVSLREYEGIDSERLLIEAEPLGKRLDQSKHGLGQVKDWLEKDKFESSIGIATDGMRWVLTKYDRDTYSHDTIAEVDLQPVFARVFESLTGEGGGIESWLESEERAILEAFLRTFEYENFLSIAGNAQRVIKETKQAITDEFYDDYVRLVFGIGTGIGAGEGEEPRARSLIGEGIIAPTEATGDDVRLFAVELMNRLVFIKFLEDKRLVDPDLLGSLREAHEGGMHLEGLYKTFLEPLFFGVLDERPSDRPERVRGISLYEGVPYLNGGLFRPVESGERGFDDREFDVRDSVLESIIDLLERYSFSADGGPTDLDPSVLGNVFEKTINHITGDAGDQKKELGAYYTPDEITRFCAEETVRPALCERFAAVMVEEWGWTEQMADYDDVYDLIEAVPDSNTDVTDSLLAEIEGFRALDPACGSGHFLTSVQAEIVAIRKALYEGHEEIPEEWELHKQTVIENIYGVDIVEPAVEIAKLRLWLSIIAEVDPESVDEYDEDELALPNVVFNVRQGNSLIGFTELMETGGDGEQARLTAWGPDSVRKRYGNVISTVSKHKRATDTEEAQRYLREAEDLLEEYRVDLDGKVLEDFREAGVEGIDLERVREFEPFHWVLEFASVYADGGFDVVVGNPPWDVLRTNRDDYFSKYDESFRFRMPEQKDKIQSDFLTNEEIEQGWKNYQHEMQARADYFNKSGVYEMQSPSIDGKRNTAENELSALFLERIFNLTSDAGYASIILPNVIFSGSSAKDLRLHLLNEMSISSIIHFENKGIFDQLHSQYWFGILTAKNTGDTMYLRGTFNEHDISILDNHTDHTVTIPRKVLEQYSPKAAIFPQISARNGGGELQVQTLEKILSHYPLDQEVDDLWRTITHRELDRTYDSDRFVESGERGDYPVYGGKNVYQFIHDTSYFDISPPEFWSVEERVDSDLSAKKRIREKEVRNLKTALYHVFDGSGSQKKFVDELLVDTRKKPLSEADVLLDCTEYRIVFRDIAAATNERTLIATVIPPGVVCHNTVRTIRPYEIQANESQLTEFPLRNIYKRIFSDRELFACLGMLNSLVFDLLIRTKTDHHILDYKFRESQMPRLTAGDDWFEYISSRAARLNCYGEAFAEMRERLGIEAATNPEERKRLQAEIDAAAFHAYGLDSEETRFVCEDFHRVQNPRLMTDDYFESVVEIYDELAEDGPKP